MTQLKWQRKEIKQGDERWSDETGLYTPPPTERGWKRKWSMNLQGKSPRETPREVTNPKSPSKLRTEQGLEFNFLSPSASPGQGQLRSRGLESEGLDAHTHCMCGFRQEYTFGSSLPHLSVEMIDHPQRSENITAEQASTLDTASLRKWRALFH